jgi:hypothetical protein
MTAMGPCPGCGVVIDLSTGSHLVEGHKADPPTLTMLDGWGACRDGKGTYYRKIVTGVASVDVTPEGVYVAEYRDHIETTAQVTSLGAVLLQAAEILAQLRAGAR